jgi:hypothetical protein
MVNDHIGPKVNQLKVSESPLGQLPACKAATWPGRSGLVRLVVKSSQVRCHDDPHLVDLAFRKLFVGWPQLHGGIPDEQAKPIVASAKLGSLIWVNWPEAYLS